LIAAQEASRSAVECKRSIKRAPLIRKRPLCWCESASLRLCAIRGLASMLYPQA